MASVEFDLSEFRAFFERLRRAAQGDFRAELILFMEGCGLDFLRIVQDEIQRRQKHNTPLLLASFHKGETDNVWEIEDDGLTLEVGTNVEYAAYVNDGHWTVSKDGTGALRDKNGNLKLFGGVTARFIPGYWNGDRFIYSPDAKGGMILKQQWVEGSHYWESAARIFEKMFPDLLDAKLEQWLKQYFGDL